MRSEVNVSWDLLYSADMFIQRSVFVAALSDTDENFLHLIFAYLAEVLQFADYSFYDLKNNFKYFIYD